jgi:hypothetical protein
MGRWLAKHSSRRLTPSYFSPLSRRVLQRWSILRATHKDAVVVFLIVESALHLGIGGPFVVLR